MFVSAEQSGSTVRRNTGERMGLDQGYFDAGLRRMVSEHIGERQRLLFCVIGAYAMAESKTTQWHPTAAYLYVLHLDGPALAWEYLRRNPDYRRDWLGRCADPRTAAGRWGLRLLEDPNRDARDALPDWAADPDSLVHIRAVGYPCGDARAFGMWRMPGHKSLSHDGHRLVLACQLARRILRVAIAPSLCDGMNYAYVVHAGDRLAQRLRAIEASLPLLDADGNEVVGVTADRPGRTAILHARMLQALDGTLAGASYREVAEVLFGNVAVGKQWYDDGDLRAQVRRVIRRGKVLMRGGYLHLAQTDTSRKGRSDRSA
jgi:hypothetical protein